MATSASRGFRAVAVVAVGRDEASEPGGPHLAADEGWTHVSMRRLPSCSQTRTLHDEVCAGVHANRHCGARAKSEPQPHCCQAGDALGVAVRVRRCNPVSRGAK